MSWYDNVIESNPENKEKLRSIYQAVREKVDTHSSKPYFKEMTLIMGRLAELAKMDFPQCRSYYDEDGKWVECEPVSEYYEQIELISRFKQLSEYENALYRGSQNYLLTSHRLNVLEQALGRCPQHDMSLSWRIAISVGNNAAVY